MTWGYKNLQALTKAKSYYQAAIDFPIEMRWNTSAQQWKLRAVGRQECRQG